MILRRVVQHIQAQNFAAILIDLVIVVVGVFLGLQVQEWSVERNRRIIEASYTERLHDDVASLLATRAGITSFRARWHSGIQSVLRVLFDGTDRPISEEECRSIAYSYIVSNPTDDLASLIELQSTGRLSMFQNERVSGALQAFLLTRARARDSRAGIAVSMKSLVSEYPDLIQVVSPTIATRVPPEPGSYRCDVGRMLATPSFLNDFEIVQSNFAFHMSDNSRVDESLLALHSVLDGVLGITH